MGDGTDCLTSGTTVDLADLHANNMIGYVGPREVVIINQKHNVPELGVKVEEYEEKL